MGNGRADWQRAWESEIGTTHQNDFETVTRHYIVDYLSEANRDIMVTEDGSYITRYVYDENGKRISAEFGYAENTQRGAAGENLQSDFATELHKVWYRTSLLNSTLFAVDASGDVVAHMIYDAWANPLVETYTDTNFSGLENLNNFTGYTWDETLGLYFAQNRFYDAATHRFTQEDIVKDGANWYVYCGNNPVNYVDTYGLLRVIDSYSDRYRLQNGKIGGTDYISKDIMLLQYRLQELGYLSSSFLKFGYFDAVTCRAVNKYKNDMGLYNKNDAQGVVGPTTWASLGLPFDAMESWRNTHSVIYVEKGVVRIDATRATLANNNIALNDLYAIALQAKEVYRQVYGTELNISDKSLYIEIVAHIKPNKLSLGKNSYVWNLVSEKTNMIDCGDGVIYPDDADRPLWDFLAGDIDFKTMSASFPDLARQLKETLV